MWWEICTDACNTICIINLFILTWTELRKIRNDWSMICWSSLLSTSIMETSSPGDLWCMQYNLHYKSFPPNLNWNEKDKKQLKQSMLILPSTNLHNGDLWHWVQLSPGWRWWNTWFIPCHSQVTKLWLS